jgi:hypothetical protein
MSDVRLLGFERFGEPVTLYPTFSRYVRIANVDISLSVYFMENLSSVGTLWFSRRGNIWK